MKKLVLLTIFAFLYSCSAKVADTQNEKYVTTKRKIYQRGISTWYGPGFDGRRTASGQIYDMFLFTAAHRTLPLGSIVRVKNVKNNREVVVLVNDRGPVNKRLILDLSKIAANNLDIPRKGSGKVEIEVLASSKNPMKKIFDAYRNLGNN